MADKIKVVNFGLTTVATLSDYNCAATEYARLSVAKSDEKKAIKDKIAFQSDILTNVIPQMADKNKRGDMKKAAEDMIKSLNDELKALDVGFSEAVKPLNKTMREVKKTIPSELYSTYTALVTDKTPETRNAFSLACMKWLNSIGVEGVSNNAVSKFADVFVTLIGTRKNYARNIASGEELRTAHTENTFKGACVESLIDYMVSVMGAFIKKDNGRLDLKFKKVEKVA